MKFEDYYKIKEVVESYEKKRSRGIKGDIVRKLERKYVEILLQGCGKNILEAGVGTGYIMEVLRKYGKAEGFDVSREMIAKTKEKFKDVKLFEASILNLRLKKKYDAIVSIRVISHFDKGNAIKALRSLRNALNKDGKVIFNLENVSVIRRTLRMMTKWGSTLNYQYSSEDVNDLMRKTGLKIDKIIYLDHLFILPIHLLNKILFNHLERFIIKLELKLSGVRFMSNNSFIKCQK